MSYGLEIRKPNSVISYSSADVTWNQVASYYVPAGGVVSAYHAPLVGREAMSMQMLINPPPIDRKSLAPNVSISGGNVYISGGNEASFIVILMR